MILINIAFFLTIAAFFIYVYKPKSKSDAWLFSLTIPIAVYLFVSAFYRFFVYPDAETSYLFASSLGECLVSIVASFITLLIYLKKKYLTGEQFQFPKWLITTIIILLALGAFSEWGNYTWNKTAKEGESKVIESQPAENISESQSEDVKELSSEAEEARKVLPELVSFINQGLPVSREGMTMNSMEIKDNSVIVSYVIDEKIMSFDEVTTDIANNAVEFFKLANANNKQIIRNIITAEYDYIAVFKAGKSGKTKIIKLFASELKDISVD